VKKKKTGSLQIYKLPNHSWHPLEWNPPGSEYDKPEIVVRRTDFAVLIRSHAWKHEEKFNWSNEFCGENRPNDTWKSVDLYVTGTSIIGILTQRAREGNAAAAMELARLASESTVYLNRILKTKPELVRELARVRRAWPVIKQKKVKLSEDEKDLFAAIQLGADDFIELDAQSAKWRFDDAGIIAYGLLTYIRAARASSANSTFYYGDFGKLAKGKLVKDFDDESAPDWWSFAKDILLFSYPEPHAIEELKSLVPPNSPKRKSPGRFKQAILRVLKSRFLSFARNTYGNTAP
jgi:hypothetical protein